MTSESGLSKTSSEVFYIVERIEDIMEAKNKSVKSRIGVAILIKWDGYASTQNTWEPIENLNMVNAIEMLDALYRNSKVNDSSRKRLLITKAIQFIQRKIKREKKAEEKKKKQKMKRRKKKKGIRKKEMRKPEKDPMEEIEDCLEQFLQKNSIKESRIKKLEHKKANQGEINICIEFKMYFILKISR